MRVQVILGLLGAALSVSAAEKAGAEDFYRVLRNDDLAGLRKLIRDGADVNVRDRVKSTPIMYAAAVGSAPAIKILLEAGADPKAANAMGATALLWGATDPERVKLLLAAGANPSARSQQGQTPLLIAAASPGAVDSIQALLEKGADVREKNNQDQTALLVKFADCNSPAYRFLIQKGADVNARDKAGFTPLIWAAAACDSDVVKTLLDKGADPNVANTFGGQVKFGNIALIGLTPLMVAAPFRDLPVMTMLLDKGANVNAQDSRGMTPLMFAVASETQNPEVVKLLLARGADVSIKSKAGETALDWARKFRNPRILELLGDKSEPGSEAGPNGDTASPKADARAAAGRALPLLQKSSAEFFRQSGCTACHHSNLTALAVAEARRAGLQVDTAAASDQLKAVRAQWDTFQPLLWQMIDPPGALDMTMYGLLHFDAERYAPDAVTDAMVHYAAVAQQPNGSWRMSGVSRSPLEESAIHRTAVVIRALKTFGFAGRKAEFARRIDMGVNWLAAARARTADERSMQLLGLKWAGKSDKLGALGRELLATQRADGGWAGNEFLPSDVYTTGQVLYTLREAGVLDTAAEARQRAVAYLVRNQAPDGSWRVRSRAPKFQPYFESGYSNGDDQWISAAGAAWAIAALVR